MVSSGEGGVCIVFLQRGLRSDIVPRPGRGTKIEEMKTQSRTSMNLVSIAQRHDNPQTITWDNASVYYSGKNFMGL